MSTSNPLVGCVTSYTVTTGGKTSYGPPGCTCTWALTKDTLPSAPGLMPLALTVSPDCPVHSLPSTA